jgi:hypothetical protein
MDYSTGINNNENLCLLGKGGDNLFEGTGLIDITGEDLCSLWSPSASKTSATVIKIKGNLFFSVI